MHTHAPTHTHTHTQTHTHTHTHTHMQHLPGYGFSNRELHARSSFVLVKISKLKAKELEACEAGDCGLAYTMD